MARHPSPPSGSIAPGPGNPPAPTAALQPLTQTALESAFGEGVKETKAPGGVAVVTTPQGRFTLRYGTGKVGTDTPIQPSDHFRIGSTTKTMVGAVVLQLAQEGSLKLSDPVSKYRSGIPNGDLITIEQLLNMRSGLASYTDTPEFGAAVDHDPTRAWQPEELLELAFSKPSHSAPDAAFYYSNTNTVLLGLIAEKLDGKPLDEVLHDRLFGPLGMRNTLLPKTTSNEIPQPHTRGYLYGTNAILLRIDTSLPPEMQAQLDAGTLPLNDVTDENPSWGWAAGAAISTADDMVTWIDALVGGKVLNAEYQKRWLEKGQPIDPAQPGIRYGLAHYSIDTPDGSTLYGHSGEIPGFNTWMLRDPKNDVTIVGWANLAPNHGDEAYVGQLVGQIYRPKAPTDAEARSSSR
jgi:D-alanyl-D-alanine carboxypeptidase